MSEISRPWSGTVTGDAGPYSDDQWTDVWKTLLAHIIASQGVAKDQLNELVIGGFAASPVTIDTGRALVNGIWYESNASVDVAIPTPAVNPRVDRIVLRADWALQTVRITRIGGAEAAAPVPPAITQVDGVTWDLPLWQVFITVGGVISVWRDERAFIGQYEPVGLSDTKVFQEWEFYGPTTIANLDIIGPFQVSLGGGFTIRDLSEAGFGAGAISFSAPGAGVGGFGAIFGFECRSDQINAHFLVRAKNPARVASLDRVLGISSSLFLTPTDGVFFRSDGLGSWFAVCRAGGVETVVNTGQVPDNVWRTYEFRQVGSSVVTFLIDGVVVATIGTDIPNNQVQQVVMSIFDDGAVAPAANDYMHVDYYRLQGDR